MTIKLNIAAAAFALVLMNIPASAGPALKSLDTDNDGTVDVAEAKAAASKVFDRLERDKDGTLDHKELKGRISKKDWSSADPDNDGTLTSDEYLATVESAFKRADKDNEGNSGFERTRDARWSGPVASDALTFPS